MIFVFIQIILYYSYNNLEAFIIKYFGIALFYNYSFIYIILEYCLHFLTSWKHSVVLINKIMNKLIN